MVKGGSRKKKGKKAKQAVQTEADKKPEEPDLKPDDTSKGQAKEDEVTPSQLEDEARKDDGIVEDHRLEA